MCGGASASPGIQSERRPEYCSGNMIGESRKTYFMIPYKLFAVADVIKNREPNLFISPFLVYSLLLNIYKENNKDLNTIYPSILDEKVIEVT